MESREISFESILKMGKVEITDVHEKDYIVYFKANGQQFSCGGGRVIHKDSVMYDNPFTKFIAKRDNDPKEIVKHEKDNKDFNDNWKGWQEHSDIIIQKAFHKMFVHFVLGDLERAIKVYEYYFDCILPGKGADKMIKELNNLQNP